MQKIVDSVSKRWRGYQMNFYEITDKDKELIKEVAHNTLQNNF